MKECWFRGEYDWKNTHKYTQTHTKESNSRNNQILAISQAKDTWDSLPSQHFHKVEHSASSSSSTSDDFIIATNQ